MLEWDKEVIPILKNNPEFRLRALCFAGSVLFHILLILAVILFFKPVEIIMKERVTDVVITPQKDFLIPHLERLLKGLRGEVASENAENSRATARSAETEEPDSQSSQPRIQMISPDKSPSPLPEFTRGFQLAPSPEDNTGFTLNISPPKDLSPEPEKYLSEAEFDLLRYLSSEMSTSRPLGTSPSTETYGARISSPGKVPFNIDQIDISPWARSVVEKIQKNWTIPTSQNDGAKNAVEITVSLAKNGDLLNVGIRNSSAHPTLDQAALNAVRMSAPFPALPDNFPNDSLEVFFLFQYND